MVKLWDARRAVGSLAIGVCIIDIVGLHKEIVDGLVENFYWSLCGTVVCTAGIIWLIKTIFLVWAWMHRKPKLDEGFFYENPSPTYFKSRGADALKQEIARLKAERPLPTYFKSRGEVERENKEAIDGLFCKDEPQPPDACEKALKLIDQLIEDIAAQEVSDIKTVDAITDALGDLKRKGE